MPDFRETVTAAIAKADKDELVELAKKDRRAVKFLLGYSNDGDPRVREAAVEALAELGEVYPDHLREIVKRLLWSINEESGSCGFFAPEALAAIGRKNPLLISGYIATMLFSAENRSVGKKLLDATARIAEKYPALVAPYRGLVEAHLASQDPRVVESADKLIRLLDK